MPIRMPLSRFTVPTKALAAVAAVALLVAGCGSSAKKAAPPTPTTTPPTTAPPTTAAPAPSTTTGGSTGGEHRTTPTTIFTAPVPTKVPNVVAKRKNVSLATCAATPGGWGASGEALNQGKAPVTYTITVYFTDVQSTVIDFAQTKVSVPPGKSTPWKASKTFPTPKSLQCVLVGVG